MVSRKKVMRPVESSKIDSSARHRAGQFIIWILIFCISLPGYAFAGVPTQTLPEFKTDLDLDASGGSIPDIGFQTSLMENIIPLSLFSVIGDPPDWPVNDMDLYQTFTIYGDIRFAQGLSLPKQPFGRYQKLVNHSAVIALLAIASITALYYSPESVSQWSDEDKDMSWDALWSRYTVKPNTDR